MSGRFNQRARNDKNMTSDLTLNTFQVNRLEFGSTTAWNAGTLVVSEEEVLQAALSDTRITGAQVELAHPGESTRVTAFKDVIEPRVKIDGPGVVYPGVDEREITAVGSGSTNRLAGMAVTEISVIKAFLIATDSTVTSNSTGPGSNLFDLSGPGAAATPYGGLHHLCLKLQVSPSLGLDDQNWALHAAALRVSDLLAAATVGKVPDEVETFDTSNPKPGLPNVAYIACMNSPEHYSDSLEAYGVSIYGVTMQTPPWVLRPTELLDGAICGAYSWEMTNNPVVLGLLRKHRAGECNFVGVITIRTRWSSQWEKDVTSNQAAEVARSLGADGAVISWDAGGNDFMEVARTVQACERAGVRTVLMTGEEDPDSGGPALLEPLAEMSAVVSTGVGANMWFERTKMPAVDRVVGSPTIELHFSPDSPLVEVDASSEIPTLQLVDHYGFGYRSSYQY
jgi:sarcosine reductase